MPDILIFIEDPGAANFLARLPRFLEQSGISSEVVADGLAIKYCHDRNLNYQIASPDKLLLDNYKLCLIGTAENNFSAGLSLIEEAKRKSITSVGIVDMWVNADKRFCGTTNNPLRYAPDWLFAPDEQTKDIFAKMGYNPNNIVITGHPHLDYLIDLYESKIDLHANKPKLLPGLKEGQLVISFVAEPHSIVKPLSTLRATDYTLEGRKDSDFRTLVVLEELLDALKQKSAAPYVVARLHPKNSLKEFAIVEKEINHFSAGGDPLDLIMASDIIFGMSSMLLQEALVLGKPVISILPRKEEYLRLPPLVQNKKRVIYSRDDLRNTINQCLGNGNNTYNDYLNQFCLTAEERTTHLSSSPSEKIVGFIKQCLKQ